MTKIVTNRCFGGFGLSHEAVLEYAKEKSLQVWPEHDGSKYGFWTYWLCPPESRPEPQDDFYSWDMDRRAASNAEHSAATLSPRDIPRDDPALVAIVERMGETANGQHAKLQVTIIPDHIDWEINEYDGNETVVEKHESW